MYDLDSRIINQLGEISKNYPIEKIVLFGSRARGDNMPASDIDLAVYALPEFSRRGHFASEVEDLETLLKIDIVIINESTNPKLLENIIKEGVVIYEQSSHKA